MGNGDDTNETDSVPTRALRQKYRYTRFSDAAVADELRSQFIREIETAAPEVLEKLHEAVWPKYIEAYNAEKHPGVHEGTGPVVFQWPEDLRQAVLTWARDVRLVHRGTPPKWVLTQVDATLRFWTWNPDSLSKGLRWGFVGGYSWERRPQDLFSIELPTFRWNWEHGFEDKQSAEHRIMNRVREIVSKRLREIEQLLENLPRVPDKRGPSTSPGQFCIKSAGAASKDLRLNGAFRNQP